MRVPSLGQEDSLEEGRATHSSILAWRMDRGALEGHGSMGSQRVGHYWSSLALTHTENETGGLGKTHIIEICEKRARSLHFILIEKGRHGNFQLRYDLVFIIKKLFWLLWDVTTEWGGTKVQTLGPVMRLFLIAIKMRDDDSLDQKKKKKNSHQCLPFILCLLCAPPPSGQRFRLTGQHTVLVTFHISYS